MTSFNQGLRQLTSSKSFNLLHSLTPTTAADPNVVSNRYHPLNRAVLERLKVEEARGPRLVVNIVATKKRVSNSSVVRSKATRRVREATYEALRERGYGKEGEPLENGTAQRRGRLVGTLSFGLTMESVLTTWVDLKKDVGGAIDKFIALRKRHYTQQKGTYAERGWYGAKRRY